MVVTLGIKLPSQLTIEIQDDGTIKVDSTKLLGDDAGILSELESLAKELGGELKIEKHVHKHQNYNTNQERIRGKK